MNNVSGTAAACLCGQTVDLLLMWNTSEGSSLTLNRKNGKLEIYIIVNLLRHKQVLSLYQQQLIYIVSRFEPLLNILTVIKACSLRYWRILSLLVTLCSVSATGCQLPLPLFFHFLCPAFHLCLPPRLFLLLISLAAFPSSPQTPTPPPLLSSLYLWWLLTENYKKTNSIHPAILFHFYPLPCTFSFSVVFALFLSCDCVDSKRASRWSRPARLCVLHTKRSTLLGRFARFLGKIPFNKLRFRKASV